MVSTFLQEGRYIAGVHTELSQNLSDFTVFPFTDFPPSPLRPVLGTCFASNFNLTTIPTLVQQVNNCTDSDTGNLCCYKAVETEVRPVKDHVTLHKHAQLCTGQTPTAHCLCHAGQYCMARKHTTSDACSLGMMHMCPWHVVLGLLCCLHAFM